MEETISWVKEVHQDLEKFVIRKEDCFQENRQVFSMHIAQVTDLSEVQNKGESK